MKESGVAPAFDGNKSIEHDISDDAGIPIYGEDEPLFPSEGGLDIAKDDDHDPSVPLAQETKVFDLPPDVLRLVAEKFQDASIIYFHEEIPVNLNKPYRTRSQANASGAISVPEKLAIITLKKYQYALTFYKDAEYAVAHLQLIDPGMAEEFEFENGKLYVQGADADSRDLTPYYDSSNDGIFDIDLALLHCLYTILLDAITPMAKDSHALEQMLDDPQYISRPITIYLRDLQKFMGYKPNSTRKTTTDLVKRIKHYVKILGLISDNDAGSERAYPVMIFEEYNEHDNTIRFASPYMRILAVKVLLSSFGNGKNNKPPHSFLIKPSIAMRHSKSDIEAFEIVSVVVRLIVQAGGFDPHIKPKTIIARCPCLKKDLDEQGPTNKRTVFEKAFKKAWANLKNYTSITTTKKFRDIILPSVIPPYTNEGLEATIELRLKRKSDENP